MLSREFKEKVRARKNDRSWSPHFEVTVSRDLVWHVPYLEYLEEWAIFELGAWEDEEVEYVIREILDESGNHPLAQEISLMVSIGDLEGARRAWERTERWGLQIRRGICYEWMDTTYYGRGDDLKYEDLKPRAVLPN